MRHTRRLLALLLSSTLLCTTVAEPVFASSATKNAQMEEQTEEVTTEGSEVQPKEEKAENSEEQSEEEQAEENHPEEEQQPEEQQPEKEPREEVPEEEQTEEEQQPDEVTSEEEQVQEAPDNSAENDEISADDAVQEEAAQEETEESEWVTETYINPLYADVIDESDLNGFDEDGIALYSADGECKDIHEAAEYMRSNMVNRVGEVTIHFTEPYRVDSTFLNDIPKEATEHTGVATEGDYLLWQYAGWRGTYRQYIQNGAFYVTDVMYSMTYYTTLEQEEEVTEKIDSLFQKWDIENLTDYQKIQEIYDYICANVKYDYENLNDTDYKLKYTAYAALLNGTAVCQGYANLLYRMVLEAGIDARFISGLGNGGAHGWNIVGLNGLYYDVDSTWDAGQAPDYYYFLKCEDNFIGHQRSDTYKTDDFNAEYPMASEDYVDQSEGGLPEAAFYSKKYANMNTLLDQTAVYSADQNSVYLVYDKKIQNGLYTAQDVTLQADLSDTVHMKKISNPAQNKEIWQITIDKSRTDDFELPVAIVYVDADGNTQNVEKNIQMVRGAGLSECEIRLDADTCYADGTEQKPSVVITFNGETFTEGTDYKLTYANNKNPGTASVTITGMGKCQGSVKKYFQIIVRDGLYHDTDMDIWYYYKDGIGYTYTGLAQDGDRKIYIVSGIMDDSYTGFVKDTDGKSYYVKAGVADLNYTGLVQNTDDQWYYVKNGVIDWNYTGLVQYNGTWYYVQSGKTNSAYIGLAQTTQGTWYYVKNGKIDPSYTGLVYYYGTWYYVQKGALNWNYNGFVQHVDKKWYYVQGGKIRFDFTGLAKHTDNKWYYAEKGIINWNYSGLAKNTYNTWYYVKNGKYDPSYTGLVYYYGTWYYVQKGALNWNYNGFVQHVDKKWYYVQGGKIRFDFTGLAKHTDNKWYYAEKGIINWNYSGLAKNTYNSWYYVKNGKFDSSYNGLVYYQGSWYCVRKGYLDWGYTSVVKYGNDWFYVEKGKLNWGYTGPAMNENGWWYIRNGKLDWNYSGKGTYKGMAYTVANGYVTFNEGNQFFVSNCTASNYTGSKMTITLTAARNEVLEDLGGTYCIFLMNSAGTQVLSTLPATVSKGESFAVSVVLESGDSFKQASMAQYAIGWKNGNTYQKISGTRFLSNPEITATMTKTYLGYYDSDKISSKKGMQGTSEGYTEDMAVQHVLLNVDIANMVSTTKKSGYVAYSYKGNTYYFQDMIALVQTIRYLNGWDNDNPYGWHSRSVTLVLLMSWKDDLSFLIHPDARRKGAATYYALNMKEQRSRDTLEALFCYMGEKLGTNKARVSNWTLGNEVNSCNAWNYSGNMSLNDCVKNYAQAFQLLYQGVKRTASTSRVFISLDHCWNAADAGHTGKAYLDTFASYMNQTAPSMQWNVNYHPYSQPLNNNRFWSDGSHTVSNTGTDYISMKNINVLTDYLSGIESKYHKPSGSIRVILGEMGYTARQGNSNEETEQAAALGYGYYIAMFNNRIDAYIVRAYIDDPTESRSGLYLGMFSSDYKKKQAYDVYKHLDKNDSLNYMNRYLSTIGISSWKNAIPGFDASKLPAKDF